MVLVENNNILDVISLVLSCANANISEPHKVSIAGKVLGI